LGTIHDELDEIEVTSGAEAEESWTEYARYYAKFQILHLLALFVEFVGLN
jgi:hypothetical protein